MFFSEFIDINTKEEKRRIEAALQMGINIKTQRGGGRLMESNTEINTNEWLLSQLEKGNFSPMREGGGGGAQNKLQFTAKLKMAESKARLRSKN